MGWSGGGGVCEIVPKTVTFACVTIFYWPLQSSDKIFLVEGVSMSLKKTGARSAWARTRGQNPLVNDNKTLDF